MTAAKKEGEQRDSFSREQKRLRRELERLDGEKNYLRLSVADLESEYSAGDLTALDYEVLKSDYSQRLQKTLEAHENLCRKLEILSEDALTAESAVSGSEAGFGGAGFRKMLGKKKTRKYLLALLIFSLLSAGVSAAFSLASDRLPGQFATGSVTLTKQALVRQQLLQAQVLGSQGHLRSAILLYGEVLRESKGNPAALSYQGWLIRLIGKSSGSKSLVKAGDRQIALVTKRDPGYANAHAFYAIALLQDFPNDKNAVVAQLNYFLKDRPGKQFLSVLGSQVAATYRALHIPLPGELARRKSS